ncbi:MAG: recombination protein RecR [Burkholderiales bacterium]|nr:recombination protein RecR [Burkholderiales bacterium]OUT78457.1 MAG: recombination protein RecR [Betaproteobacteria bacterium TMED22]
MKTPQALESVIDSLKKLPGVGPKAAQRMAFHLMQHDKEGAQNIAEALINALGRVRHCERCNNFSEQPVCDLCQSMKRDDSVICVVEMPSDVQSIEQTQSFKGHYFVLLGRLSPLDGVGPKEIGLDRLIARASEDVVKEVIVATNFTNEGEATAHYISEKLIPLGLTVTRLSRGVPAGGEIEYVDIGTLAQSIIERKSAD